MTRKKPAPIADEQELLRTVTSLVRGEMTEEATRKVGGTEERIQVPPKISERLKGLELMGKYYGLFEKKEESRQEEGDTARRVMALLAEMHERSNGPEPGSP